MSLSDKTISRLADALKPEVIEYIYEDERWMEFLHEVVYDAIQEKLGKVDDEILLDLATGVMNRISLK